jgi:hypothetical protein
MCYEWLKLICTLDPDFVVTDAGKNFVSKELFQLAMSLGTTAVSVPIEAH